MNLISILDCTTLGFTLLALVILLARWRRAFHYDVKLLIVVLLLSMGFYSLSLFLEWSEVNTKLDPFEDIVGALIPMWWAFLFYALLQNIARDDLRESEARFRRLTENAKDIIYRMSLPDGRYEYVSPAVLDICEQSPEQWYGNPKIIEELMHPDWQGYFEEEWEKLLAGNMSESYEYPIITPSGRQRWLFQRNVLVRDEQGSPIAIEGIVTDITERKQAEKELEYQNALLTTQSESSPDGVLVVDPQRNWISVNRRFIEMWNLPLRDTTGGSDEKSLPLLSKQIVDPKYFLARIEHLYEHPEEKSHDQLELCDDRFIERYSESLFGENGQLLGRAWFFRDLTDQKQLENQLRQAQKMEAVGQLAGGVAHDFNNILQAIIWSTELALLRADTDSQVYAELQQIMSASSQAADLIRQLLAFGRRQVMQYTELDLNDAVDNMAKMIRRIIGEDIQLGVNFESGSVVVHADKSQVEQILMNLCVNARDAMPDGGTLTIETTHTLLDEEYCRSTTWAKPGRYGILSVSDTGQGMDLETQSHIFEPFFTTKEVGKGTGLGLSTVFGIVRQHDGFINVQSEMGKGTIFQIYLPISNTTAALMESDVPQSPPPGGSETILLGEDNEMVRIVAKEILEMAGYRVLVAEDGKEAIRMFDENIDQIDLVLLDVVMPKAGGRSVHEHIVKCRPETKVIFASGYSSSLVHEDFDLGRENRLIQKPYRSDNLLRQIREVLDE